MASGGMGDVLTGVCAGLVGRELSMYDAGRVGAWICGRAAEMSIFQKNASEESLLASLILRPTRVRAALRAVSPPPNLAADGTKPGCKRRRTRRTFRAKQDDRTAHR